MYILFSSRSNSWWWMGLFKKSMSTLVEPWMVSSPPPQRRLVLAIARYQSIWCCGGALPLIKALGLVYVVSCLNLKRLLSKTSLSTLQGIIVIYVNNGDYLLFQLFFFFISSSFPELCKYIFYCILPAPTHYLNLYIQSFSTLYPWKLHKTSGLFSHKLYFFFQGGEGHTLATGDG